MANFIPTNPDVDRTHWWFDEVPTEDPPGVEETGNHVCAMCGCTLDDPKAMERCTVLTP